MGQFMVNYVNQYLTGEIGQSMFKIAKRFLCDDCRSKYLLIANRL